MGADGQPSWRDTGSAVGKDELAISLSKLAQSLPQQDAPDKTLVAVVEAVVELMPGVREGSISSSWTLGRSPRRRRQVSCRGGLTRCRRRPAKDRAWTPSTRSKRSASRHAHRDALADLSPAGLEAGAGGMLAPAVRPRGRPRCRDRRLPRGSATHHVESSSSHR